MAFPAGWQRKCSITIDATKVAGSGTFTDYPALITEDMLPSEMLDSDGSYPAQNGGGDLRFTSDEAGTTQLACEVVEFVTNANPALGTALVWVKVPSLSGSTNTTIWVWYNAGGSESQPAVGAAYGRNAVWADYELVSHDLVTDSTGNGSLTDSGTVSATGPYGFDGRDFDTGADKITSSLTANATLRTYQWASNVDTLSMSTYGRVFEKRVSSSELELIYFDIGATPKTFVYTRFWSTNRGRWKVVNEPSVGAWEYRALTYDGGDVANDPAFYLNGTAETVSELDTPAGTLSTNSDAYVIGNRGNDNARRFDGKLALCRIRDSILSADWLATEYENLNAPSTFASAGTPASVDAQIPIGFGSETDTAFALAASAEVATGLAIETDAAFALTARAETAASFATEIDTAFALTASAETSAGFALETDAAFALAASAFAPMGLATETDAAFALEIESAYSVTPGLETDQGFALTASAVASMGFAVETDTAPALTASAVATASFAVETDEALALISSASTPYGLATETDTGFALVATAVAAMSFASETNTAFALPASAIVGIGYAEETNTAFRLEIAVISETPASRRFAIAQADASLRRFRIAPAGILERTFAIRASTLAERTFIIRS